MALHPNWKALSTVDFSWKLFVREGSSRTEESTKAKKISGNYITGEEAKHIYEQVVGSDFSLEDKPSSSTVHSKETSVCTRFFGPSFRANKFQDREKWVNAVMTEAQKNSVVGVKDLLSDSCDVDVRDQYRWTPLMSAACAGALDVVEFLIGLGADANLRDRSGNTCLSLAKARGHLAVVQALKKGATTSHRETTAKGQHSGSRPAEFYCESCKQSFRNTSREQHATSTVHLFSTRSQIAVPTVYGIPASNKGYQILVKGGWDREKGLGPEGSGHRFPLKTVLKRNREGLGGDSREKARVTHFSAHSVKAISSERTARKSSSRRNREAALSRDRRKERELRRELGDTH